MSKIVSGYFIASDAAVNVECGFEPDFVSMISALGGTELEFSFHKLLADLAEDGQYGFTFSTTGVPAPAASGSGIATYDTSVLKQMLPAPTGVGLSGADLPSAFGAGTAHPTARSTSVLGTITKPSIGLENGLIFECTTSTGVYGTEPTWPTLPGQTVTDDQSNVWTARESIIEDQGVKGFTIQAGIATNGEKWIYRAEQHDKSQDQGDADVTNPVKF